MVTSHKIDENQMGDRGSKSEIFSPQPNKISVKEQRVDGNYFGTYPKLRCTLMGCENSYQIKIPSNQFFKNKKLFSTNTKSEAEINPWFLTGFVDAEGCFSVKIQQNANLKTKWRVRPVFSITLHIKEKALLESLKSKLGVGHISKSGNKAVMYAVDSIKEIPVIINHFDKYPLITKKLSDYLIFKNCFNIIKQGHHLTERGLLEIISLKSNLNLGLPVKLKEAFPNITIVRRTNFCSQLCSNKSKREEYKFNGIPDPFWISGFTSGEGSFHVLSRNSNNELFARFSIHLHIRDLEVLKAISTYFYLNFCSQLCSNKSKSEQVTQQPAVKKVTLTEKSAHLQISKFSDVNNIIIPFFNKHPILGLKSLDFLDFKKICKLMKTKEHLSNRSVFNQILEIKSGMNLNRKK